MELEFSNKTTSEYESEIRTPGHILPNDSSWSIFGIYTGIKDFYYGKIDPILLRARQGCVKKDGIEKIGVKLTEKRFLNASRYTTLENETPFKNFEDLLKILRYVTSSEHPTTIVTGSRITYGSDLPKYRGVLISHDSVDGLGDFTEVEIMTKTKSQVPRAISKIKSVMEEMGILKEQFDQRTYPEMQVEKTISSFLKDQTGTILPYKVASEFGCNPHRVENICGQMGLPYQQPTNPAQLPLSPPSIGGNLDIVEMISDMQKEI
jgi:adenylate cyclase class IV